MALFFALFLVFFPTLVFASESVPAAKAPADFQHVRQDEINSFLDDAFRSLGKPVGELEAPSTFGQEFYNPVGQSEAEILILPAGVKAAPSPPSPSRTDASVDSVVAFQEAVRLDIETSRKELRVKKDDLLPGGRLRMSGKYRLAAGASTQDFILNRANADLQERNFRYIFGERLNNTFDPAIYDQYLLNVDFSPKDRWDVYTQIVADPWSWVGTTGEQIIRNQDGTSTIRPNFKYFGAFNGVLNEVYRANTGDAVATPLTEVENGHTTSFVTTGFTDFGTRYAVPELNMDYELRPLRKLWVDYNQEKWHTRVFAFADESQALSTDDPLGLSNHKDYWQQSPWLYQYVPIQFFTDRSIKRGHYSDSLSFLARDSEGNRLVLLRGASLEADLGKTYIAATVASPFTPWDEKYHTVNNMPGAIRIKHQSTDKMTIGTTYTFRTGLVNNSIADFNQAMGVDTQYQINQHLKALAEIAGSHREKEINTNDDLRASTEGFAYKAELDADFDHKMDGHTDFELSFTQMDQEFEPALSRYTNTRDDHFWGNHITFDEISPELERFRIGDGVDVNRFVIRARWREKLFKERFMNLIDIRNVHKTNNTAYKETVAREEVTYRVNPQVTAKGLFRWHGLPHTTPSVEPFISNFYVADVQDPVYQNVAIPADKDPSRFTTSGGLQYVLNKQWTAEGIVERTNDIPDFPRGLLNGSFRDTNDRVEGLLFDRITNFLYGQSAFGAVPPYDYFTIWRERVIYRPDERVTFTFHSAQNSYKFAAGIDDNINHQGLSVAYQTSKSLKFFMDYTRSSLIDVPNLIASNFNVNNLMDYNEHHNFYASMDYRINASQVFRAEYGVFGLGFNAPQVSPYSTASFSLPTIDTEHLFRVSLTGDF